MQGKWHLQKDYIGNKEIQTVGFALEMRTLVSFKLWPHIPTEGNILLVSPRMMARLFLVMSRKLHFFGILIKTDWELLNLLGLCIICMNFYLL